MSPLRSLAFSVLRHAVPWRLRKRLNKYRGPGFAVRWKLAREPILKVLSGPFRGLIYPRYSTGSEYFPKLLGTYEMELHELVEGLRARRFSSIVVVGAGEGYYVGGLAGLLPGLPLASFESDPCGREAVAEMSRTNGFAERLDNRGLCTPGLLAEVLSASVDPLLVMDVEGAERTLLDPNGVPALRHTTILVEVHDCYEPGLDALLRERFQGTHRRQEILARARTSADAATVPVDPALQNRLLPLID